MYTFIVNPNARTGLGLKIWNRTEEILKEKGIEYQIVLTKNRYHATEFISELTADSKDHTIVVMGGDGTINEVVNGIRYPEKVTLGYIPIGSGNDFARGLGLTADPEKALEKILKQEHIIPFNLGVTTYDGSKSRFAVSSGIGFDADVCHKVGDSPVKSFLNKLKLGKLSYVVVAIQSILGMKPYHMEITVDDQKTITFDKVYFSAAQNLPFEGGGFKFCPKADPGDGQLDLIVAERFSKLQILLLLPTAFAGQHVHFKGIHIYRGKKIHITCSPAGPVHTDGEGRLAHHSVEFSLEPESIQLIKS